MSSTFSLKSLDGGTLYPRVAATPDEYRSKVKTYMGLAVSLDGSISIYSIYDPSKNGGQSLIEKIDSGGSDSITLSFYKDTAYSQLAWEGPMKWISQGTGILPSSSTLSYDSSSKKLTITRGTEIVELQDTSTTLSIDSAYQISTIVTELLGSSESLTVTAQEPTSKTIEVTASTWSGTLNINLVARASNVGDRLDAKQADFNSPSTWGSLLQGGLGNDQLWGKAGWDIIDGGAGNDLIRAGNGRDIITGGLGADELHGDFGWNTFKSEKDGFSDLIAIKSDQFLTNWIYGKAGNNANGEKADIIEGLDANDKIRIIGIDSKDISIRAGATAHGVSGIGIYAAGALEALYTGGDLSVAQLTAMTSGDGSAAAMANQVSSYGWTGV